ncbi:MAG: KH domain-containing protein [Nitrososphaerales archaeon]
MTFEQTLKIPIDRIGALLGKQGSTKAEIEKMCNVSINVDSNTGEVPVKIKGAVEEAEPFKALAIINAISRGFSPQRAFKLTKDNTTLETIDLREYAGRSKDALTRIKGRIIGQNGKARRVIEELTRTEVSVYGHTVSIIGEPEGVKLAAEAVKTLASGSQHSTVYRMLQRARQKAKLERLKLWEEE